MFPFRRVEGYATDENGHIRVLIYQDQRTMNTRMDIVRWDVHTKQKQLAKFVDGKIQWVDQGEGMDYPGDVGIMIDPQISSLFLEAAANAGADTGIRIEKLSLQENLVSEIRGKLVAQEEHLQDLRHLLDLPPKKHVEN